MLHERADAIYTEIVGRPGFVSASHFARLMCDRTSRARAAMLGPS